MLTEISQTQNAIYCTNSIYMFRIGKSIDIRSRLVFSKDWENGEIHNDWWLRCKESVCIA